LALGKVGFDKLEEKPPGPLHVKLAAGLEFTLRDAVWFVQTVEPATTNAGVGFTTTWAVAVEVQPKELV
jgi:hypothetical protein